MADKVDQPNYHQCSLLTWSFHLNTSKESDFFFSVTQERFKEWYSLMLRNKKFKFSLLPSALFEEKKFFANNEAFSLK